MHLIYSRTLVAAAAWLATISPALAQIPELDELETLSVGALVAAIASENHHLQELGAAVEAAQLRIEPASARPDPMLSYTIWPNSISSIVGTRQGAQLSQPFRWPGKRELRAAVAGEHANMAIENREAALLDVFAAAKLAFSEWHYVDSALAINASNQELLSELIGIAETRYASGRGLQQDVLQAEVEQVTLQRQRLTLDQQRRSISANINQLLNRDPQRTLPPPARLGPPGPLPVFDEVRAAIEIAHPKIRRLEAALAASRSRAELEDMSSRPDFNAYLSYSNAWDEVDKRLQLGVSINLPFGRSKRDAERGAARAEVRQSEHELRGQRTMLLAALETAYAEIEESEATLELYEQRLLPLAEDTLEAALADYQSGAGQFINVIAAERQKLATEQASERALADYWRRRAELDRIIGAN